MDANKRQASRVYASSLSPNSRQLLLAVVMATLTLALVSDLARMLARQPGSNQKLAAWASWIGEVPTAAELYGDAANEMPTTEAFDDDDEDEELDASASNEYPDSENENDESYEDPEEQEGEQESRRSERWLPKAKSPAAQVGGHAIWADLEGWRRNKRDLEDRIVLASRRAAQRRKSDAAADDEFSVEDGDEDAWVHDGVDDIHIDPETKRAASELSYDEQSIDAEYDPQQRQAPGVLNRTRTTTITDVIPMSRDSLDAGDAASGRDSRFVAPPAPLVPAAYLTLEQAQRLVEQRRLEEGGRPLAGRADRFRRDRGSTGGGSGAGPEARP